jgi:hypothetical protein
MTLRSKRPFAAMVGSAVALSLAASAAFAQAGPLTRSMTCQSARQIVASRGAAVLSTGRYDYDRYVSGSHLCVRGETIEPAWVPTVDTPQCFVGYRCREIDLEIFGR